MPTRRLKRAGPTAMEADWRQELGPWLTRTELAEYLRVGSPAAIDKIVREHRLIAMPAGDGTWHYPAFQVHDGRLLDDLVDAFWTVAASTESGWTAASWCVAADDALEGFSPADWAARGGDPGCLARVARQDAARLNR